MNRILILALALALALMLALAACSTSQPSATSLEDAVRAYSSAFLSGQGEKAAEMLSTRCNTPAIHEQVVQAAANAPALYGQAKLVSVEPVVNGDRGVVTYRFDQPAIDQHGQPWVYEGGAWRYDQC